MAAKKGKLNLDYLFVLSVGASLLVVLVTALQQQKQAQDKIASREEQLRQKNEIIDELKGIVTGGESYFFLRPSKVVNANEVLFILEFRGQFPVYDGSISIEEFNYEVGEKNQFQYRKTDQRVFEIGTIHPLRQKNLFTVAVPRLNGDSQFGRRYFFSINTRNGLVEEDVLVRQEAPHFSFAYKVVRMKPDYSAQGLPTMGLREIQRKIKHIDPAFPVHELDHLEGDTGWLAKYDETSGTDIHRRNPQDGKQSE